MSSKKIIIRNAKPSEFEEIGKLMVNVYSQLVGFPKLKDQPEYYKMLANIADQTNKPETELLVALSCDEKIYGAVVYFGDMQYYGSGGTATKEKYASGFRFLAVDPESRGMGIGKLLTLACIEKARLKKQKKVVIHTTKAMQVAWDMYEKIGFERATDLDFIQVDLPVYGFRYKLA